MTISKKKKINNKKLCRFNYWGYPVLTVITRTWWKIYQELPAERWGSTVLQHTLIWPASWAVSGKCTNQQWFLKLVLSMLNFRSDVEYLSPKAYLERGRYWRCLFTSLSLNLKGFSGLFASGFQDSPQPARTEKKKCRVLWVFFAEVSFQWLHCKSCRSKWSELAKSLVKAVSWQHWHVDRHEIKVLFRIDGQLTLIKVFIHV